MGFILDTIATVVILGVLALIVSTIGIGSLTTVYAIFSKHAVGKPDLGPAHLKIKTHAYDYDED